jgi:ATP-dependent DNA helicase RecG
MPLPLSITDLLHGKTVEWERLELKAGWNPLDVLHTLCAFANDFHNFGGGYILIGVAEQDGRPVLPPVGLSLEGLDSIQKELLNLGHSAMKPSYHPIAAPYEIDGRQILVLWAPGGQTRPYRARMTLGKDDRDYGWFIRKGSSTVVARGADETELMSLAPTVPFDDRVNQRATVEDLSRPLIIEFLTEVGSELALPAATLPLAELGRQMHVVGGSPEAPFPLNVGLLFFNPAPHRFFPGTQIDVVWFPEGPGADRFTEKEFRGPIHRILRDALDHIDRLYITVTVIKHRDRPQADRVFNFPLDAIEEALVNAIYHRSYEEREPVEVRIGREELSVVSYPGPDRSVKLEALRAGRAMSRRYRNRRIGELLKELDLTEGRGTGISKIVRAMKVNGSPPPVFEFDEDHSYFAVVLPIHVAASPRGGTEQVTGEVTLQVTPQVDPATPDVTPQVDPATPEVTLQVTPEVDPATPEVVSTDNNHVVKPEERDALQVTLQVTLQVESELLLLLSSVSDEPSTRQILTRLGLVDRANLRDLYLLPALAEGLVEMTRPDKPRSSKQRYRLTEKGRVWLARSKP